MKSRRCRGRQESAMCRIPKKSHRHPIAFLSIPLAVIGLVLNPAPVLSQTDPNLQRMVDSISVPRLSDYIRVLESAGGHVSRVNFTPGNDSAAAYLRRAFDAIPGLTSVVDDTFYIGTASGGLNLKPLVNIVATLRGITRPEQVFVVGAHFDCSGSRMGSSWSSQWQTMLVPGADDNATGLALILEMARIMSDGSFGYSPEATIQFIAFGAEESGPAYSGSHHGSRHFADSVKTEGLDVLGMVSIDMIGYNPLHFYQSIITNAASTSLAAEFVTAASIYAPQLLASPADDASATYSDHDSFWREGYQAVCLMENAPPWNSNAYYQANPFYHKSSDTSGTVNMELVRLVARMALAAVATVADEPTDVRELIPGTVPATCALEQNYPNPFNPKTNIRYQIAPARPGESPSAGGDSRLATLVVYDILGREVGTLVNEVKRPGAYSVEFDGSGVVSGVYIYRLIVGTFTQSGKMLLVK